MTGSNTVSADPTSPPPAPGRSAFGDLADTLSAEAAVALDWLRRTVLSVDVSTQIVILLFAILPAALFGRHLQRLIARTLVAGAPQGVLKRAASAFAVVATPVALLVILQIGVIALGSLSRPSRIVEAGVSLLAAWIIIRLVTLVIRSRFWSQLAFYLAWPIAALDAFGALGEVMAELDAFAIPIGMNADKTPITFSALDFLRAILVFAALFAAASLGARLIKSRIEKIDELTTSAKALLARILDVLAPVVALVVALQLVGFPFATLAIFGGAVGLGLGLGLQRTVANLFAGFTLIADKSIKPGDVIEIGETFGWVTQMNGRYVTVRTRDGTEHLVPNERFIQDGVVNWSHSDRLVRLHAAFAVAYGTNDLRAVKQLAEETAAATERVVKAPQPVCNLVEFGDHAIKFDLRFWIQDPANGIGNVKSAVMLALWDALRARDIEMPYPQLDIRVKELPPAGAAKL
jgi:small-conductance mechanosensitive channel